MKAATQGKLSLLVDAPSDMDVDTDAGNCEKYKDFDELVDLLLDKCKESPRKEKIQMLRSVPDSKSKQKTQETFGVSEYLVR